MSLKWNRYVQNLRRREISIIFSKYNHINFSKGLELGAGSGFQSTILSKYTKRLISTELNESRLIRRNIESVEYKICDAEIIDHYFQSSSFDLVFSSNMFEHLPKPENALKGIHKIIKADGLVILIMPSVFWKICHIFLHYPLKIAGYFAKRFKPKQKNEAFDDDITTKPGNNVKSIENKRNRLLTFLRWPEPHGVSESNFEEILKFRKKYWINLFKDNGFYIHEIIKGPVASGYGLQLDTLRVILEFLGFTGEYIYIIKPRK